MKWINDNRCSTQRRRLVFSITYTKLYQLFKSTIQMEDVSSSTVCPLSGSRRKAEKRKTNSIKWALSHGNLIHAHSSWNCFCAKVVHIAQGTFNSIFYGTILDGGNDFDYETHFIFIHRTESKWREKKYGIQIGRQQLQQTLALVLGDRMRKKITQRVYKREECRQSWHAHRPSGHTHFTFNIISYKPTKSHDIEPF